MNIRRSEDALDDFWTSYVRSIYVLCPVFADPLLMLSYEQGALQQELRIGLFIDHFEKTTLWNSSDNFCRYFKQNFWAMLFRWLAAGSELCTKSSTKVARSCLLLLSYNAWKKLLWKSLNDKFHQYLEQFA